MMMVMMVMMVMIWGPWWGPFTPVRPPGRVVYACSAYSLANRRKWDCGTTYTFIRPTLYLHTRIHDGRVCVCQLTVAVNSNWQHNDLCLAAITTQRNAASDLMLGTVLTGEKRSNTSHTHLVTCEPGMIAKQVLFTFCLCVCMSVCSRKTEKKLLIRNYVIYIFISPKAW